MEITHRTRNLSIAPRKLRLVADQLRYQTADKALAVLPLIPNKGAGLVYKSLKSAIQTAKDNDLDAASLVIKRVWCDEATAMKRLVGRSRGRMARIMKKHSHLSLVLEGQPQVRAKRKSAKAEVAPAEETATTTEELTA